MEKTTHGIFSPKENRPEDPRIPKEWRDRFHEFTGLQPTYEEYINSPDIWDVEFNETRAGVALTLLVLAMVILSFFSGAE